MGGITWKESVVIKGCTQNRMKRKRERGWIGRSAAVSPLWGHCPALDVHSAVCVGPLCAESSMCDWTTWSQRVSISPPTHTYGYKL